MYKKLATCLLACLAVTVGCGGTDYYLMARFQPDKDKPAVMAMGRVSAGPYTCGDGDYRITLSGTGVELQQLVKPGSYPGVEKYEPHTKVVASIGDRFMDLHVEALGQYSRVVVGPETILTSEIRRLGGSLLTCKQIVQ